MAARGRILPLMVLMAMTMSSMQVATFCGTFPPSGSIPPSVPRGIWSKKPAQVPDPDKGRDISDMSMSDVSRWLEDLGLTSYVAKFRHESIDGLMLSNLTDDDLQVLGVDSPMHRKKILQRRDAPKQETPDEWALDLGSGDALLEPQRVVPSLLVRMRKAKKPFDPRFEAFLKTLDQVLFEVLKEDSLLDALSHSTFLVCHTTANGPDGSKTCVREEAQTDLEHLMQQKLQCAEKLVAIPEAAKQLVICLDAYWKLSDREKEKSKAQLEECFQKWEEKMSEQEGRSSSIAGLMDRAKARLKSQGSGGAALASNWDAYGSLVREREEAARKCQNILDLAEDDVQLALLARQKNGLQDEIRSVPWLFCFVRG